MSGEGVVGMEEVVSGEKLQINKISDNTLQSLKFGNHGGRSKKTAHK